jgi:hypothetical protein
MRELLTWVLIIGVLGAVAVIAFVSGLTSDGGPQSTAIKDGGTQITWQNNINRIEVRYSGTIQLAEDDRDILQITPQGYVHLVEKGVLEIVRIELKSRAGDTLERKFFIDGREMPYDPAGKTWFAAVLPNVVRRAGLAAEARVERILKGQGMAGVLAEISDLKSDYVKRNYFLTLFEQAKPTGHAFAQAISHAGQTIYDDHEFRQLLDSIVGQAIVDPVARDAYFESALTIDSDNELASLLVRVAETLALDATFRVSYFEVLRTVDSDSEHRRVLSALIGRVSDPAILSAMIESLNQITSNYEAAEFLVSLAEHHTLDERVRALYLDATRRLTPEYERNRAVAALARN